MADTKLGTFLSSNKINQDRLLAVSHKLETLQKADRDSKQLRRKAKGEGADEAAKEAAKAAAKPRSGRPVTPRALAGALAGKPVSGPTKQRILRAVNYLLEQKKKDKVELKTLF